MQRALHEFSDVFASTSDESALNGSIRDVCVKHGVGVQDFYKAAYSITIGREKGPKLVPFLLAVQKPFVVQRFKGVV